MKKIIAIALVGAVVLSIGQFAYCGGHGGHGGRPPPPPRHGGGGHHGGCYHHGGWSDWDTFGAVCAGVLGAGLIAAAVSDWDRPTYSYASYPTYVAPAPVYQPVTYYPAPGVTYQRTVTTYETGPAPCYPYYGPYYGGYTCYRQYGY